MDGKNIQKGKRWSWEDDLNIWEHHTCEGISELAQRVGRGTGSIRFRLKHLQNPQHAAYQRLHAKLEEKKKIPLFVTGLGDSEDEEGGVVCGLEKEDSSIAAQSTGMCDTTADTNSEELISHTSLENLLTPHQEVTPPSEEEDVILNTKQQKAFDAVKEGKNIFITGSGGTGKTLLLKKIIDWAKSTRYFQQSQAVSVTSTTGVSAVLIGGTTLHSFAGIGHGDGDIQEHIKYIRMRKVYRERWRQVRLWIMDEISMLSPEIFDLLDHVGRALVNRSLPFGGIQMVFSGDFCQLPNIDSDCFCFEATSWNHVVQEVHYLTQIHRQQDVLFQKCLNEIRLGQCSPETQQLLEARVGVTLTRCNGILPTVLYARRMAVDRHNHKKNK